MDNEPEVLAGGPEERRPSTRKVPSIAAVVAGLFVVISAAAVTAAVHYRHESQQVGGSSPIAPASAPPVVASPYPSVARKTFRLLNGRLHIDVVAVTASGSDDGTLLLDGRLTGARPGRRYRITGGDCTAHRDNRLWASGVADPHGVAFLRGHPRTMPITDRYFASLDGVPFRVNDQRLTGVAGALLQVTALPTHVVEAVC